MRWHFCFCAACLLHAPRRFDWPQPRRDPGLSVCKRLRRGVPSPGIVFLHASNPLPWPLLSSVTDGPAWALVGHHAFCCPAWQAHGHAGQAWGRAAKGTCGWQFACHAALGRAPCIPQTLLQFYPVTRTIVHCSPRSGLCLQPLSMQIPKAKVLDSWDLHGCSTMPILHACLTS